MLEEPVKQVHQRFYAATNPSKLTAAFVVKVVIYPELSLEQLVGRAGPARMPEFANPLLQPGYPQTVKCRRPGCGKQLTNENQDFVFVRDEGWFCRRPCSLVWKAVHWGQDRGGR